ncbi:hypothetical protein MPH_12838, partial [Macrophomina phaseolina MS6]
EPPQNTQFHDDAYIATSWKQGHIDEFIKASKDVSLPPRYPPPLSLYSSRKEKKEEKEKANISSSSGLRARQGVHVHHAPHHRPDGRRAGHARGLEDEGDHHVPLHAAEHRGRQRGRLPLLLPAREARRQVGRLLLHAAVRQGQDGPRAPGPHLRHPGEGGHEVPVGLQVSGLARGPDRDAAEAGSQLARAREGYTLQEVQGLVGGQGRQAELDWHGYD